jgi:serine/threonine protein kinase
MASPRGGSRVGTIFGPYELRSLIGVGGMGEVYRAYDTVKDRMVAVKLLRPEMAVDTGFQERFRRESRVAARLQEPHVIPVHDWGEIGGVLYIDMRLVEGANLRDVLRHSGPLEPRRASWIIAQVAAALDAAHADGLIHRDIKPENVLLTASDFAYLVDFGIARAGGDPSLTTTGAAIGSCAYMAPERFSGRQVGRHADIYALACLLYECLTARPPFPVADLGALMKSHMLSPPPRPTVARPGLNPAFDDIIARGMAKQPATRFSSASELATATTAAASAPQSQAPAAGLVGAPQRTRQFTSVYSNPVDTGYTPYAPPPAVAAKAVRGPRFGRTKLLMMVASMVAAFVAAASIGAFLLSRTNTSTSTTATLFPPPVHAPTITESTTPTTTTTQDMSTQSAPTTTSTSTVMSAAPTSTTATLGGSVAGTDTQGFVGSYARCDPGNAPAAIAQTTKSQVVVCQTTPGTFYYRAVRVSDGAAIQLANAVRSSAGFDVTNPADGTRYQVRPNEVNIIQPDGRVNSEPTVQYASS